MQRRQKVRLAAVALVFMIVLGLALARGYSAAAVEVVQGPRAQETNPTPSEIEADQSVAGSTDGIFWIGAAISAIIILPLLANKFFWRREA